MNVLTEKQTSVLYTFGDPEIDECDPEAIIEYAADHSSKEHDEAWRVCYAASLIVGRFTDRTRDLAGRIGKEVSTIEFYAKSWRVREYVQSEEVFSSAAVGGVASADFVCRHLSPTHYGIIHSHVFLSIRGNTQMFYLPIIRAKSVLEFLADCLTTMNTEQKIVSAKALLMNMKVIPCTTQWDEGWDTLINTIKDFTLQFGEHMPPVLRAILSELIRIDWSAYFVEVTADEIQTAIIGLLEDKEINHESHNTV